MAEEKKGPEDAAFIGESIELNLDQLPATSVPKNDKGEYYDRWVRVSADFDNYRKRLQKEKQEWLQYGPERFVKSLLPVMDNLERAMRQCSTIESAETKPILEGLKLVFSQFERVFKEHGITPFDPQGENFNPLLHDAIATGAKEGVEAGKVLEVHQKGYKLYDKLLRPAGVTVSSDPAKVEE